MICNTSHIYNNMLLTTLKRKAQQSKRDIKRKRCKQEKGSHEILFKNSAVCRLTMDLWILIGDHLSGHPHSVFLLSMVNRCLRDSFSSIVWWNGFYDKVVLYQSTERKVSKYVRKMKQIRNILSTEEDNLLKLQVENDDDRTGVVINKSRRTLNLVFGMKCQHCGCTRGHYLIKSLMMRSCVQCLQKNWISNTVLYFHYGLSYYDFIEQYYSAGGMLIPSYTYNCDDLMSLGLSLRKRQYKRPRVSAVDSSSWSSGGLRQHENHARYIRKYLEGSLLFDSGSLISLKGGSPHLLNDGSCYYHHCQFTKIKETSADKSQILFWRPDLERLLHLDFQSLESEQLRRIKAAQFLTALCARLANFHFHIVNLKPIEPNNKQKTALVSWASVIQNDKNGSIMVQKQQLVTKQKYIENLRPKYKLCLPRTWIPGGPFFAYYDSTYSPRRLSDFWWRPGFDMHKYDFINRVIIRKYKHKLCQRYFGIPS